MDKPAMARANRVGELRALAAKMTPEQLADEAKVAGLKFIGDETREEMEFEVAEAVVVTEEKAAAQAIADKAVAEQRAEREAFYQTKEGKKQRAIDERDARDHAVRKVNAGFCSALPSSARMQGTHQPHPDADGGVVWPVPDGRYRVSGSQWVMSFRDGKWTSADQAHNRTEPDWLDIPDHAGGHVSAKSPPGERY